MENFTTFGKRISKLFLFVLSFLISANGAIAQADLQLSLAVDNPNYSAQEVKTFTLNLQNTGPENASNINVSFLIPNVLSFSGANATIGNYDPVSSEWIVSTLDAGQTATLTVMLFVNSDQNELTLFAQVLSVDQADPDSSPGNNNGPTPNEDDEAAITLTPIQSDNIADMELTMTSNFNSIEVGQQVIIDLVAFNKGPRDANNIIIAVDIPAGFSILSSSPTIGGYSNGSWTIPNFDNGNTGGLTIVAQADVNNGTAIFFAQFQSTDTNDSDSTPGNNNGTTPHEDDEAAVSIEVTGNANCLLTNAGVNVSCNDNGTPQLDDDTFTITLNPTGQNLGNFYNVTGGIIANDLAYGTDSDIGTFPIFDGAITINIEDASGTCQLNDIVIDPPSPCSIGIPDCSLSDAGLVITCDDNGTPEMEDDLFVVTINPQGTDLSDTYNVTGDITVNGISYGTAIELGSFAISDGNKMITITDASGDCQIANIAITAPQPCSTGTPDCILSDAGLIITCDDNGTPEMEDDLFVVTINPQGTDLSDTYNVTGDISAEGLSYGATRNIGSFAISDGNLNINIVDDSGNCQMNNIAITAPEPCSSGTTDCTLSDVGLVITCNDNGTADQTDDTYTVTINPQGTDLSTSYIVTGDINGNGFSYGTDNNLGTFLITDGNKTISIIDDSGNCQLDNIAITAPEPCSSGITDCALSDAGLVITCDDNGTADRTDDSYTITINPQGSDLSDTYFLNGDINGNGFSYGTDNNLGTFLITDGNKNITIVDDSGNCQLDVLITAPEPCSDVTPGTASIAGTVWLDADRDASCDGDCATQAVEGIQVILFEAGDFSTAIMDRITDASGHYQFTNVATDKTYVIKVVHNDELVSSPITGIDNGVNRDGFSVDFTLTDGGNKTLNIALVDGTMCTLTQIFTRTECNDNGTADPSDDFFTISYRAEGAGKYLVTGTDLEKENNYGDWIEVGINYPINSEPVRLVFTNLSTFPNLDCSFILFVEAPEPCSDDTPTADGIDLELSLTADNTDFNIYEYVIYTLTVENKGSQKATGVRIDFQQPMETAFVSQYLDKGTYYNWTGIWKDIDLEPGEKASLKLRIFTLFGDKPLVAFAQVIAADQDDVDSTPDNANNMTANEDDEALLTLGAVGPTDLELELSAPSSSFKIYENTNFTCKVTNTSNVLATNISVKFPLPKGMVYTNAHTQNGNYSLYHETWVIGSLAPGETASLELILFHLENDAPVLAYAEVKTQSPNDLDSTPDNYATNPDEDDSDTVMLNAVQKRSVEIPETEIDQTQKLKIFEVYPNPVVEDFQVVLTSKITTEIQLQMYDLQGRLVKEKEMMMIPGPNRIRLNLSQQTSGIYKLLILYQNGKLLTTTILKQQ